MTLTPAFLDEVRARTSLSQLVGASVKLTRAGNEMKGCCPFHHEKTPSFYVNDDKGFYHCFGCSAHGDAIRWMTEQRGLPFIDAVKELAAVAGLEMPAQDRREVERAERAKGLHEACGDAAAWFAEQLHGIAGSEARGVLAKRGIKAETARAFGLGFAPDSRGKLKAALNDYGEPMLVEAGLLIQVDGKDPYDRFRGRLMIPIRDPRGRTIAFGGRVIGAKEDGRGEPKYLNSPDTPLFDKGRTLFNLDKAAGPARKAGRVIVVEGYMDVIALAQAGVAEAVAPLGTALSEGQMERLWRMVDVPVLCFDGDAAGQKAALRAARRALPLLAPGRSLAFATLPPGQDPDDLVRTGGAAAMEGVLGATQPLVERLWEAEVAAGELRTPEERAALGARLRALAATIQDEYVRSEYLATFNRMVWDYFHPEKPSEAFGRLRRSTSKQPVAERLKAISQFGIDQVTLIPAAIKGLINRPYLIGPLAERLGDIPINAQKLRITREAMLEAALVQGDLETEGLRAILKAEGRADVLQQMDSVKLAFSFLNPQCDATEADRDLSLVVETLASAPAIKAEIDAAQERRNEWSAADFDEYVQLLAFRRDAEQVFMDALMPDDAPLDVD